MSTAATSPIINNVKIRLVVAFKDLSVLKDRAAYWEAESKIQPTYIKFQHYSNYFVFQNYLEEYNPNKSTLAYTVFNSGKVNITGFKSTQATQFAASLFYEHFQVNCSGTLLLDNICASGSFNQ